MKRVLIAVIAVAVALVLPACKNKDDQLKALRRALDKTEHLSNRFVYAVQTPDQSSDVRGIVEDDFRFKAGVSYGGQPAYEEVVDDDTLAVRFLDPTKVSTFITQGNSSALLASTDFAGVTVADALRGRRWVVDRQGAPALASVGGADVRQGNDPVLDALTVLEYVRRASDEAFGVKRFDPDSISPVYKASEDTFPKPQKGSGVARYDFERPFLPPITAVGRGGEAAFPQTKHFRRMAVYVKDGQVINVREAIDLRGKSLADFVNYQRALLKAAKLPSSTISEFDHLVKTTPQSQLGTDLLEFLNAGLTQAGLPPITVRQMSFELRSVGTDQSISLPDDGVIRGSLAGLTLSRKATNATATADTGSTSSTKVPVTAP